MCDHWDSNSGSLLIKQKDALAPDLMKYHMNIEPARLYVENTASSWHHLRWACQISERTDDLY